MIRIFINSFNRLTWTMELLEQCKRFPDSEVVIIDNDSNYQPLLDWYATKPCEVVAQEGNFGPRGPWASDVIAHMATPLYVVTDPDLDISGVPSDALEYLQRGLSGNCKSGLSLEIADLPDNMLRETILQDESRYWTCHLANGFWQAPVDTTFALYNKATLDINDFLSGVRADRPYTARHLPWYTDPQNPTEEEKYYLAHAKAQGMLRWTPMYQKLVR